MKKMFITIVLAFTASIAFSNFSDILSGDTIESGLFNKLQNAINHILDIKVSTGPNIYSAFIVEDGSYSLENTPWLDTCVNSAGKITCSLHGDLNLTNKLICQITNTSASRSYDWFLVNESTPTQIVFWHYNYTGSVQVSRPSIVTCHRSGSDFFEYKSIRSIITEAGFFF